MNVLAEVLHQWAEDYWLHEEMRQFYSGISPAPAQPDYFTDLASTGLLVLLPLDPDRLGKTQSFLKGYLFCAGFIKHCVSKSTSGYSLSCFPLPVISYGQESNLLIHLFKGSVIEMLMFKLFTLQTKCPREVTFNEPQQDIGK